MLFVHQSRVSFEIALDPRGIGNCQLGPRNVNDERRLLKHEG